jgi:hypothetical protein
MSNAIPYSSKAQATFLGGPGDSGVQYVLELANSFRKIIGPQYDLVGFDPRGEYYSNSDAEIRG